MLADATTVATLALGVAPWRSPPPWERPRATLTSSAAEARNRCTSQPTSMATPQSPAGWRARTHTGWPPRGRGGPGPVVTTPAGIAFLQFSSLPRTLRVVVSDGRWGGAPVPGSLKARVRGVTDGDVVHVNPITTLADVWARKGDGLEPPPTAHVVERTLGIRRVLDPLELSVTDLWFNGDRFLRWTLERGSVGAAAGALVRIASNGRGSTAAVSPAWTRKGSPTPAPPPSIRRAQPRSQAT